MRLIDVDAFREDYALAERCEDCQRYGKKDCDYPYYSARDFCGWLDDAPTVGGWVSVKDRMPNEKINPNTHDFEYVLCYTIFGDVRAYKYGTPMFAKSPHFWDDAENVDEYVTHWQYMPEPPKEVSE